MTYITKIDIINSTSQYSLYFFEFALTKPEIAANIACKKKCELSMKMLKTRRNANFKFTLSANPTKCSNTIKQFAGKY